MVLLDPRPERWDSFSELEVKGIADIKRKRVSADARHTAEATTREDHLRLSGNMTPDMTRDK